MQILKFSAFKFDQNVLFNFFRNKKTKYLLITSVLLLIFLLTYSTVWHLRYPVSDWNTHTINKVGIDIKLPSNLKITTAYNESFIHITGEKIKHPKVFTHLEDVAYQRTYSCPGMSGTCTNSISKDFFLRITQYSPAPIAYQHLTDAYFIDKSYSIVSIDGYKAYKKENWMIVPPGLEKHISISLVKGNKQINFDGYIPFDERMYDRLFNQIISTIKIQ